jgi:hypothetical protein
MELLSLIAGTMNRPSGHDKSAPTEMASYPRVTAL